MDLKPPHLVIVLRNANIDVTAAYDTAFPMQIVDNSVTIEERLWALPSCLWAMVSKAICQGAAMVLATAQL